VGNFLESNSQVCIRFYPAALVIPRASGKFELGFAKETDGIFNGFPVVKMLRNCLMKLSSSYSQCCAEITCCESLIDNFEGDVMNYQFPIDLIEYALRLDPSFILVYSDFVTSFSAHRRKSNSNKESLDTEFVSIEQQDFANLFIIKCLESDWDCVSMDVEFQNNTIVRCVGTIF
jgi:hypothetical protein